VKNYISSKDNATPVKASELFKNQRGTTIRRSRGSSVSIVTDYGLDDRGSIPDRGRGFLFQSLRPDRLWGPPSLLSNGYRGPFPRGYSGVKQGKARP
jgi:hypothetical protein